ncbi:MAG: hypothetical protein ACTSPI_13820 [Candidatus Heimdallarchaeaceae archaeon]
MNNGLDITEEQFMKMNSKERDLIMFRNVTHIRKKFKDYSFHRKIQYVWLFALSIAIGFKKYLPI